MITGLLLSWLILTFAFWITARALPAVHLKGVGDTLLVATAFGLLNATIGWIIFAVLGLATFGLGFLLAGITRFIATAVVLWITDKLFKRFRIDGLKWTLIAAAMIAVIGLVGDLILRAL